MINKIISNQNKHIKHAKSLSMKKYRDISGQYLIEGIKLMREAYLNDIGLDMVFISSDIVENEEIKSIADICNKKGISTHEIDNRIFKEISETESSQGIIGIAKKKYYNLHDILESKTVNLIVLDEVQDPGNVGTIIRTADACDFNGVILSKGCVDIYNSKAVRATMGSLFHLPIVTNIEIEEIMNIFDKADVNTIGADPHDGISCFDLDYKDKNAIIIGNESSGLSKIVKDRVEGKANIPMPGRAESLNAAVAASILMYEIIRSKLKK